MRGRTRFAAIAGGAARPVVAGPILAALGVVCVLAAPASAATVLHVTEFSGYQTIKTGSTSASTTFTVPKVTCGSTTTGIQPGIEATVAPNYNGTSYLYGATLQMTCTNGVLAVTEAMFASGLETDAMDPVATGDTIKASFTSSSTGSVVTLQDTAAARAFKLTDSGTESYATGQFLGVAAVSAGGSFVPAPTFTPVSFTQALVAGKPLNNASVKTALQYGSNSVCLVYTIPTAILKSEDFTVETPPVNITGYGPTTEPVGQVVTIMGYGFTSRSTVTFTGNAPSKSVKFISSTELQAVVPDNAIPGPITVTNARNPTGTMTDLCSNNDQPVIMKLSKTSGPTGTAITITGGGFNNITALKIGAYPFPATSYTRKGPTLVDATIPNGALTGDIEMDTMWGNYTTASPFKVTLSITGFSPTSGPAGTVVDIQGVGFNITSRAKFGGIVATKTTFMSSTELRATVPSKFAGPGVVQVTNSAAPPGTVTAPGSFG